MIALYVADIPAACNNPAWLTSFKAKIGAKFKTKDLGALLNCLACTLPVTDLPAPFRSTNRST
jgi:hypothetical protein